MATISINSKARSEMIDITSRVADMVPAGFAGICHLFCLHTTAGLTINENADPDVVSDIMSVMNDKIPWNDSRYRHGEGNSAAHVKSSVFGPSLTVPVDNGRLTLGTWQGIYFCEFDGPRTGRKVDVKFIPE